MTESGEIISRLKSFPRFNEQGEENIFCPNTGTKLLTHCNNCSRSIDSGNITYCMSCGKSLGKYKIPSFTINNIDFISNQASIDKECKILEEKIESEKEKMMYFYNWLPLDEILEGYCPEDGYDQDFEHEFLDSFKDNQKWIDSMLNGFDSKHFNWAEFREKHEASNKTIRDTWCCYYLALSYYKGIIKELRRYSLRLSSSDIEDK